MSKQLNIDVNLNTAKASAQLKSLTSQIQEAINSSNSKGTLTREIVSATEAATKLKTILNSSMNSKGNLDLSKFSANLKSSGTSLTQYAQQLNNLGSTGQQAFMNMAKQIATAQAPLKQTNTLTTQLFTSLKNTARWQLSSAVLHGVVNTFHNAFSYAKGLNESLNSIRIVTGLSANEMDKFAKAANTSAKALSASTLDYTDAALIYYQQGIRDQKQIKERTDATIKMANVTGDSAAKVSNQLTAIWNNFAKGGDNLEYYADVITALGAATASSSAEISAGLEKFASIAEETGLSYEYATSSLATIVATTRQSADVVGTALKTIFGRVQSLNLGETLDDGTTLGKYSKALSQVGINIKDQNGQLKDMDNILDEMGAKWQGLNRDQRVALAQSVAGARQYNQLMALMENYDFFKENVAIAKGSEGELTKQADIYAESWQAARDRVKASWQGILDDVISDKFFIGLNNVFAGLLDNVNKFTSAIGGMPGVLGLVGAAFTKVFQKPINNGINNLITSVKTFKKDYVKEQVALQKDLGASVSAITPRKDSPQSDIIQTNNLKQSITLSTAYAQKMQAIIQSGKTISNQDKVRITTLQDMVNLYSELELKAQQQVEAEQAATETIQARIAAQAESRAISSTTGSQGAQIMAGINAKEESEKLTNTAIQSYRTALMGQAGLKSIRNGFDLSSEMRSNLGNLAAQALTRISPTIQSSLTYEDFISKYGFRLNGKNLPRNISSKDLFTQFVAGTLDNKYEVWEKEKRGAITPFTKRYTGSYNDMVNQSLNPAYAAAQRSEKFFSSNRFDRVAKHVSDAYKAGVYGKEVQDLTAAEKKIYDKSQKALKYIDQRAKDLDFQGTEKYMSTAVIAAAKNGKQGAELRQSIENEVNALYQKETTGQIKNASIKELTQQIQNLNGQEINKGFSNAAMGVANLSIGISSLVSGFKALNDESMSFGDKLLQTSMSFGMAIPMLTTGIGSMATNIPKMVKGISDLTKTGLLKNTLGYSAAIAAGGTEAGMAFVGDRNLRNAIGARIAQSRYSRFAEKQLAANAGMTAREVSQAYAKKYGTKDFKSGALGNAEARKGQVEQIKQGTGKGTGAAAAGGLSMLQVAGIVAALAALAVIIAKIKKEIHEASLEGQLEKAVEEGNSLSSALDEAKSSAEGLKSAFDSYHGIADSLNKCTTGTQEWTEALRANNNEVISLMSQYPELAKIQGAIQKNADGSLSISKEAEEQMNKMAQDRVDTLSWAKLANTELQQSLQDQMDLKTRSREMMEMQRAGQDKSIEYNGIYGFRFKDTARTSDFDTDMISGFSYVNGGDSASLDAAERQQLRQSKGAGQLTEVSANQKANELLLENWGELQALSGESLTQALGKVMTEGGLKITDEDLAKYSAGVESAAYRAEMTKMYNQQKAQQDAFETQQIGLINNKLASEGILDNDSKTRDLLSNIFGKQLDERTKEAVAADKEAYNRGGAEQKALAEAYVQAMGGDTNSISWQGNEFSYLDSAGQKIEGITGAMVASVTGAASALDQLAGSAEAAAGAFKAISNNQQGEAIRDFIKNGDFTKTQRGDIKSLIGGAFDEEEGYNEKDIASRLISSMGGLSNAKEIAATFNMSIEEYLQSMAEALFKEDQWGRSEERAQTINDLLQSSVVGKDRLQNYSRADLETLQRYEKSKIGDGPVKTMQELETAAEAAGDAQEYLNRTWKDGTRLSSEQQANLKNIISDSEQYGLVVDENSGKIKDAALLQDMLHNSIDSVGREAMRSQQPLFQQLNELYDELYNNGQAMSVDRADAILNEISLIEKEIDAYNTLAIAQSGALKAYDKIAEGAEYDAAHDFTDELEGAVKSIYSHMEDGDWDTFEWGSREGQAAIEALVPELDLDYKGPGGNPYKGMTMEEAKQHYMEFYYGNGKKDGRYMDKNGSINKRGVDNFVEDITHGGDRSAYGYDYSGIVNSVDWDNGTFDFVNTFSGYDDKTGQVSLAAAAESMHMTEAAFVSMISAMDKYNGSGQSFFEMFNLEGAEAASQISALNAEIEKSGEALRDAYANGTPEEIDAALTTYGQKLQQQKEYQQQAVKDVMEYNTLMTQANSIAEKNGGLANYEQWAPEAQEAYTHIQQTMANMEGIEIKLNLVTDEVAIDNIKSQIQSAFEGDEFNANNLEVGDWQNILSTISNMENPFQGWKDAGLDKIFTDAEKLPGVMKEALSNLGKDKSWITELNKGVKDGLTSEGDPLDIEVDTDGISDAITEAVKAAESSIEPIKVPMEVVDENGKPVKNSKGTSSYTGSTSNNPDHEGSTTGGSSGRRQPKQQQQQQVQSQTATVTVDVVGTEKITAITNAIASIPATIPLSISGNITNVSDHIATLSGLLHSLGGAVPVLTITDNTAEVGGKIQQLKTKALQLNGIKPRIAISSNASAVLGSVTALGNALRRIKSPPPIHISITADPIPRLPGFVPPAFGTARAYGNAFAKGQWGTGTGPIPALVGELGQELIVDPANGKFYTVGDAGAEFITLPKNAIVFNHKQTEQLLKYRKINSRGQAMADGNVNQTAVTTEGFDINGLIKNAGTVVVVNNYTGTNPNAKKDSASSSGNDSTSAGTDERIQWEEKLITVIRDEVDVYKEINKQLDRLEHQVDWFERNLDRLFGIHLMDQYAKTIEKLNVLYQRQVKAVDEYKEISNVDKESLSHLLIQWEEKVEDKDSKAGGRKYNTNRASQIQDAFEMMMTYGGLSADAFTRNANGVVEDWDRVATQVALAKMKQNAEITWNSRVHDESLTEVQRTQYENEYNYIIQMVEQITAALGHAEDSMDKIEDAAETAQDTLEKMHDLSAQQLKTQLQIHIDLMDNQKKLLDFALKRIPDVMGHQMDRYLKLFDGSLKSGTDAFDIIKNKLKEYEKSNSEADRRLQLGRDSNGQDPNAINEKDWAEIKQQAFDGIMDSLNALIETRDELAEAYDHTAKVGIDEIEKLTTQMEHSVSVLDHLQNLLELTGRKFDFEAKETIIQGSKHNLKNTLDEAIYWSDLMTENRVEAEKQYQELLETDAAGAEWYKQNVLDKAVEMEIEADEKKYEAAEKYAQKVEELWKNTMEKVAYNWEKAATKGEGWDYLTKSMERAKAIQEEYLTTTNKLYETNTLLNKLSKDMNKTDSQASKEKIASFQKEVENAQLSTKLAKSQMDILKARYEILQAEMALEDAKNAKSTVRLQRDNEGNYGYVYTADQDKVDDAEQNLLDKQNDLYNLVLNIQNETQEKIIQSRREFQDQYNQIWQDYYDGKIATVEERENKIAELKQQYSELWEAYDIDLTESDYWLNQVAADGVSEAWAHSYQDRISTQDEFMAECADAADELTAIMDEVNEARKYLTEEAKLGLEDVKKKTEEVTKKNDELAKQLHITVTAVDAELDAIRNLTAEFAAQYSELEALIDQYYALAEAINAALMAEAGMQQEGRPDYSLLIADAYGRGDMAEVERLTGIREQVIDIEGLTQDQYGMRTAGLNKIMDVGVSAGYTGEELSKWGIDAYQGLYRLGIDVSDDKFSQDAVTKIMGRYIMEGEEAAVEEFKKIQGLDTGGYTGEWGSNGKLAILHEKELVLNPNDTSNLLEALKIAKENYMQSIQTQRLQSLYEQQMIASTEQLTSAAFQNNTGSLQQDVTIHAEFPNVTERNEIAEAFKTLVNEASQFANRY